MNEPLRSEEVFVVAPLGRDCELVCRALGNAGILAHPCGEVAELRGRLDARAGAAVITEETLSYSGLRLLEEFVAKQPAWSDFPFVVFSSARETEARLSTNALTRLGNVTIVERPVQIRALVTAVQSALRARRRQYDGERAIRERDQFLAMLGHELRNPLGAILFANEVLGRFDSTSPVIAKNRALIDRQARQLGRLVDDLLDVSRVTSGKIALKTRPIAIDEIVRRCLQAAEPLLGGARFRVSFRVRDESLFVDGDAIRLEQVFTNLLNNAAKYTPDGGRIEVTVEKRDGNAVVSVRDDGVGVPPEMQDRIFELFAQVDTSLHRSKGGLGLGLTLVRTLIGLHGGSVRCVSEGAGKGSEFQVSLPLCEAEARAELATDGGVSTRLRVVIVEDNPDLRDSLVTLLADAGHDVQASADGLEGLSRIIAIRPDAAVIDIGLPGIDGYELAHRVRDALGPMIRMVALTGYNQPEDRKRAFDAGFDAHLQKPVDIDLLSRTLSLERASVRTTR